MSTWKQKCFIQQNNGLFQKENLCKQFDTTFSWLQSLCHGKTSKMLFSDTYFSVKIVLPFPGTAWIPHICGHSTAALAAAFLMSSPSAVQKKPELAQAWQRTKNGLLSASQSYYILNFHPLLSNKCHVYFHHCNGTMGL